MTRRNVSLLAAIGTNVLMLLLSIRTLTLTCQGQSTGTDDLLYLPVQHGGAHGLVNGFGLGTLSVQAGQITFSEGARPDHNFSVSCADFLDHAGSADFDSSVEIRLPNKKYSLDSLDSPLKKSLVRRICG